MNWDAVSGATSYDLRRADDAGMTTNVTTVFTGAGTTYNDDDAGLTEDTDYYYDVRANSGAGSSDRSAAVQVRTLIGDIDWDNDVTTLGQAKDSGLVYLSGVDAPIGTVGIYEFETGQEGASEHLTGVPLRYPNCIRMGDGRFALGYMQRPEAPYWMEPTIIAFDPTTNTFEDKTDLGVLETGSPDNHPSPSIIYTNDNHIVTAVEVVHNSEIIIRRSTNVDDITAWDANQSVSANSAYPSLIRYGGDNIALIVRFNLDTIRMFVSTNNGATFGNLQTLCDIDGDNDDRAYHSIPAQPISSEFYVVVSNRVTDAGPSYNWKKHWVLKVDPAAETVKNVEETFTKTSGTLTKAELDTNYLAYDATGIDSQNAKIPISFVTPAGKFYMMLENPDVAGGGDPLIVDFDSGSWRAREITLESGFTYATIDPTGQNGDWSSVIALSETDFVGTRRVQFKGADNLALMISNDAGLTWNYMETMFPFNPLGVEDACFSGNYWEGTQLIAFGENRKERYGDISVAKYDKL